MRVTRFPIFDYRLTNHPNSIGCGMWYGRVMDSRHQNQTRQVFVRPRAPFDPNRRRSFGNIAFGPKPLPKLGEKFSMKKRPPEDITTGNEAAPFKRVRLICREQRVAEHTPKPIAYFTSLLEKRETRLGTSHPRTIKAMVALAGSFRIQHDFEAAENLLERAMDLQDRSNPSSNLAVARILEAMITVLIDQSKLEVAEILCRQLVDLLQSHFGSEHCEALRSQNQLEYVLQLLREVPDRNLVVDASMPAITEARASQIFCESSLRSDAVRQTRDNPQLLPECETSTFEGKDRDDKRIKKVKTNSSKVEEIALEAPVKRTLEKSPCAPPVCGNPVESLTYLNPTTLSNLDSPESLGSPSGSSHGTGLIVTAGSSANSVIFDYDFENCRVYHAVSPKSSQHSRKSH